MTEARGICAKHLPEASAKEIPSPSSSLKWWLGKGSLATKGGGLGLAAEGAAWPADQLTHAVGALAAGEVAPPAARLLLRAPQPASVALVARTDLLLLLLLLMPRRRGQRCGQILCPTLDPSTPKGPRPYYGP